MDALERLMRILRGYERLIVSYSGGADSAFLLHHAVIVLGRENVKAFMIVNEAFPDVQRASALEYASWMGVDVEIIETPLVKIPSFMDNPKDRCARCKDSMYQNLMESSDGWPIADGATQTDVSKGRIGLIVAGRYGIKHPLADAGFTDSSLRRTAGELGLPFADTASTTCLATRFARDDPITHEELRRVEKAEEIIMDMGFKLARARTAGDSVRIELPLDDIPRMIQPQTLEHLTERLKVLGYDEITIDPEGYRENPD